MPALLEVDDLTKAFGGLVAVGGISLSVEPGEILGLIGPNGSGKSTTLNLIAGTLSPDRGSIRLDGRDVTGLANHRRVRARINRTFQLVRILPGLTVRENILAGVLYGADPVGRTAARARTEELLRYFDLTAKAEMTGSQITYIDQKRVELARAWATGPRVLLLDEWLSGLNPTELQEGIAIVRRLSAEGLGIILVEHVIPAVRALCGRAVVMSAGKPIAAGETAAVLNDPRVQDAYLGQSHAAA